MHRLTHSEAAHLLGLTADQVRRRAQSGGLERAEPIDGKQAVTFRSVAAFAIETGRHLGTEPVDLAPFEDLSASIRQFHLLGIERAVFLRQLEADALEREQSGQLTTAAVLWQVVHGLRNATYAWQPTRGTWVCTVPGVGTVETSTTPATPATAAAPEMNAPASEAE